jgi:integrase
MAKKRTGTLIWQKRGWSARVPVVIDAVKVKRVYYLGTDSKAVARRKLARLLEDIERGELPTAAEAARAETVREAAERIVDRQRDNGLGTWRDRRARLRAYVFEPIGQLPVGDVKAGHVREVLDAAHAAGKSKQTLQHIRNDLLGIFGELWRDEVIESNPVERVKIPDGAKVEERRRVLLSDLEFDRFMASPDVDAELHTMAFASRSLGGMRTSDLHAWDWSHIDTLNWSDAHVPRPKTKRHRGRKQERLSLGVLARVLQAWWSSHGRPSAGPVFPCRRGPRAGMPKVRMSYAEPLRNALWAAGVHRPMAGFGPAFERWQVLLAAAERDRKVIAAAEEQARALCLIQSGSNDFLPLDFHSFRRAYNTALADEGVNVQEAMALAGHRSPTTHMVYVDLAQRTALAAPAAALPALPARFAPERAVEAPQLPAPAVWTFSVSVAEDADRVCSIFSSGQDRFRTCDIRLVRPALYR